MAERPILFSGPMVRAIIEGRKTQTRRVYKPTAGFPRVDGEVTPASSDQWTEWGPCPYGVTGDVLWVREKWFEEYDPATVRPYSPPRYCYAATHDGEQPIFMDGNGAAEVNRDGSLKSPWRPSIHMPRAACRLTLAVKAVRVERLQKISEGDIYAEGIELSGTTVACMKEEERAARGAFAALWDSIYAKRREPSHITNRRRKGKATQRYDASHPERPTPHAWANNPWVWVVEFEKEAPRG